MDGGHFMAVAAKGELDIFSNQAKAILTVFLLLLMVDFGPELAVILNLMVYAPTIPLVALLEIVSLRLINSVLSVTFFLIRICFTKNEGGQPGVPPTTVAEFNMLSWGVAPYQDYYDVSQVDGFNVPMQVIPIENTFSPQRN